jgi:hypothetical protein
VLPALAVTTGASSTPVTVMPLVAPALSSAPSLTLNVTVRSSVDGAWLVFSYVTARRIVW